MYIADKKMCVTSHFYHLLEIKLTVNVFLGLPIFEIKALIREKTAIIYKAGDKMTRLETAINNSEFISFRMKYRPDFPIEFLCGDNPFCETDTAVLGEIIYPDDYRPFCEVIGEVINGRQEKFKVHARLLANGIYKWFYISAAPEIRADGSMAAISGMMFDVTQYFSGDGEDSVMLGYRNNVRETVDSVNHPPRLSDILGVEYLKHIQEPFSHIDGLYSVIVCENGEIIAADGQDAEINLNKMNYQRKMDIRIKHQNVASWIIASDSFNNIDGSAPLLEVMVQTVSGMANSYLVISEEMENSQKANKLLGQNFEDQILINNIYSMILQSKDTNSSFGCVIPLIKEYFELDEILFCLDNANPITVYKWNKNGSIMLSEVKANIIPNVDRELNNNSVLCLPESEVRGTGNRSFALSRIYENGSSRGVIVFISPKSDRVWTNRDRKVIGNITQIISTVIYRSFMENQLAASQESLMRLAYYNTTTGIPNRSAFERDFRDKIAEGDSGAVISIEIANLKHLTEIYSTQYADDIVKSIAEYISAIPTEDPKKVYRFSNDVLFVMIEDSSREEAMSFAQAILVKFKTPWFLNDSENRLDIYAGVGMFPENANDIADCVRVATRTLRLAKDRKLHDVVCYSEGLEERLNDNQRVRKLITDSAENGFKGFYFLYTPITDAETGELYSCEAHLYWTNDDIIISRERFQSIIQQLDASMNLFRFVADKICNFCAMIREAGIPDFRVEFSFPEYTMNDDESTAILRDAVLEYSLPPDALNILIQESDGTMGLSAKSLKQIRDIGMGITADDRGGNFFTSALLDNPYITAIKIRSRRLSDDIITASFVKSLIERSHNNGVEVAVKGVDSPDALERARDFGADTVQGIINGRPLHSTEFLQKLVKPVSK